MQKINKRTYHLRSLKAKRAYSFDEIAELLNVHKNTVHQWKKEGMPLIDTENIPYLAMGQDIKDFLRTKLKNRKHPLQAGEFFCPKCKVPRKSIPDQISIQVTDRQLGKTQKQVFILGVCAICGQALRLFSSEAKAQIWTKKEPSPTEQHKLINGSEDSSINADTLKGQEND